MNNYDEDDDGLYEDYYAILNVQHEVANFISQNPQSNFIFRQHKTRSIAHFANLV
jgi:hypothetical protein